MFCTKCGIELREQDEFCSECGTSSGRGAPATPRGDRLTRSVKDYKIAGVCGGFFRFFDLGVTLGWGILGGVALLPLPLFGVSSSILCWLVLPEEEVTATATQMYPR